MNKTGYCGKGDLYRNAYYFLGLLIDSEKMPCVIDFIEETCNYEQFIPKYLVTVNLHYVFSSLKDEKFREIVLNADRCSPDGMPLVWVSRFLNIPIYERVTGADLLPELIERKFDRNYKIFMFGSTHNSLERASKIIDSESKSLRVADFLSPEFGDVYDLSKDEYIKRINQANADILFISLDAEKALKWIDLNRSKLNVKFICQIGASIDFLSGKLKRAPRWMQYMGFEWLYRFRLEPLKLWKRYLIDICLLIFIFLVKLLPCKLLYVCKKINKFREEHLSFKQTENEQSVNVKINGTINKLNINKAREYFLELLKKERNIEFDLSELGIIDNMGLGLFQLLNNIMKQKNKNVKYRSMRKCVSCVAKCNFFKFK